MLMFSIDNIFVEFAGHIFHKSSASPWNKLCTFSCYFYLYYLFLLQRLKYMRSHLGILIMFCQFIIQAFLMEQNDKKGNTTLFGTISKSIRLTVVTESKSIILTHIFMPAHFSCLAYAFE